MKKLLIILMVLILALSTVACDGLTEDKPDPIHIWGFWYCILERTDDKQEDIADKGMALRFNHKDLAIYENFIYDRDYSYSFKNNELKYTDNENGIVASASWEIINGDFFLVLDYGEYELVCVETSLHDFFDVELEPYYPDREGEVITSFFEIHEILSNQQDWTQVDIEVSGQSQNTVTEEMRTISFQKDGTVKTDATGGGEVEGQWSLIPYLLNMGTLGDDIEAMPLVVANDGINYLYLIYPLDDERLAVVYEPAK